MNRPNLYAGLSGLLSYSPGRSNLENPFIYDPFNDYGATPVIGVQWEWQRGLYDAKTQKARAELNAVVAQASLARSGIPYQVLEKYQRVQASYASVQELRDGAKNARRWMISTYADFEAGVEETSEVVSAFQAYVLAYTEYLQQVYDYNMQVAKLEHATGAYQ
jgi:outer membrane protein TolC